MEALLPEVRYPDVVVMFESKTLLMPGVITVEAAIELANMLADCIEVAGGLRSSTEGTDAVPQTLLGTG